jgi:hypothetical protein
MPRQSLDAFRQGGIATLGRSRANALGAAVSAAASRSSPSAAPSAISKPLATVIASRIAGQRPRRSPAPAAFAAFGSRSPAAAPCGPPPPRGARNCVSRSRAAASAARVAARLHRHPASRFLPSPPLRAGRREALRHWRHRGRPDRAAAFRARTWPGPHASRASRRARSSAPRRAVSSDKAACAAAYAPTRPPQAPLPPRSVRRLPFRRWRRRLRPSRSRL